MAKTLYVEIVAPAGSAFRGEASRFRAPGAEGSFEVLYNHAPLIAATDIGTTVITDPRAGAWCSRRVRDSWRSSTTA
jgi:F-type H+-transporting ATPase subunit epsilon